MQKRILTFFGIAGALAGLFVLLYLMTRETPRLGYPETVQPPVQEAPPPKDDLKAETQNGTVKGTVVNGLNDKPIAGATVIALHPYLERSKDDGQAPLWGQLRETARIKTNSAGRFEIKDLPKNFWNLWVEKRGFGFTTLPRAKFDEDHVIKIFPSCSVRGRVVYEDDTPAANVKVEYTPQGTHSEVFGRWRLAAYRGTTDKDGYFEYTEIPPGKFTIEVYPEDYLPGPWLYQKPLTPGENRDLGVRKLDRGFGMKVYVLWRGTNEPVEGVEVVVTPVGDPMPRTKTGRRKHTNARGFVRMSGLGGQVLEKPRFQVNANVAGVGVVRPDEQRLFSPDETVTIYLRKNSTVLGKVVRPNGQPLEHFRVDLQPIGFLRGQKGAWGENGEFTIYSVPEGDYIMHVRYGNLIDQHKKITAVAGQKTNVGVISMQAGAEIIGVVRNHNGSALEGLVRVHLAKKVYNERVQRDEWETVGRAYCKKDGSYFIKGLPPGTFWIWPQNTQSQSATTDPEKIEIGESTGSIPKDIWIYAEARLKLRFMDEVSGTVREVVQPPATFVEARTGKEIRWLGEGTPLRPGRYTVYFHLKNKAGVLQRYKWKELSVQETASEDPIEVRLYEIRNGG